MIEVGDPLPNLSLSIKDSDGALADGGAVTLTITLPDQTVLSSPADLQIVHPNQGNYYATYVTTQVGSHTVVWTVTGANAGVFTDTPYVESQLSIVSLSEIKQHLGVRQSANDEILRQIGIMASDACESPEGTNRRWRRRTIKNEVHAADSVIQLYNAPVISITSLFRQDVALFAESYDIDLNTGLLYEINGAFSSATRKFGITVSYVAGSASNQVPALVRDGVLEMCRHLYSIHRGGANLPTQTEPDYTTSLGYLVPNRVAYAWQAAPRIPG